MSADPITFALVAEGPSDHLVIQWLFETLPWSKAPLHVNLVQPRVDEDTGGASSAPGWREVFRFLDSDGVLEALQRNDFLIIQIDTDVCDEQYFGVARQDGPEFLTAVRNRLIREIGDVRWETIRRRVVFAITVSSVECWLLPFTNVNDAGHRKTVGCMKTLNMWLGKAHKFTIDPEQKPLKYYVRALKVLKVPNARLIDSTLAKQPSLRQFVTEVQAIIDDKAPYG